MRPRIAVFALAAVGCYSPSYRDCEVHCESGVCPGGYFCDPGLALCRPEGMTGPCPAPIDDAAPSMDTLRDSPDGSVGTYCSMQMGTVLLCHDLDVGSLQSQGWTFTTSNNGGTTLVPSVRSQPNALESFTPPEVAGVIGEGRATDTFLIPNAYTELIVAFDMNIAERSMPGAPKGVFTVRVANYFTIDVASSGAAGISIGNVGANTIGDSTVGVDMWSRYELRFTVSGNALTVSGFRDGISLGTLGDVTRPPTGADWEVHVGGAGNGPNGMCRFDYDNILVTAKP